MKKSVKSQCEEQGHSGPEVDHESQDKSRMSKCGRCLEWCSREFHPYKIFPMTKWIQNYERSFIIRDLVAGLTIGLLMVPLCFANSELAGLDPYLGSGIHAPFGPPTPGCGLLRNFSAFFGPVRCGLVRGPTGSGM